MGDTFDCHFHNCELIFSWYSQALGDPVKVEHLVNSKNF